MATTRVLGEVDLPEGILVILDPGLAQFWRSDGSPASPLVRDPEQWDLAITGPDALAAGRAYDRQWDPRFLYDVTDVAKVQDHFASFARERGFSARAEPLAARVPHTARVHRALELAGIAVVPYNRLWAVCVGGLPSTAPLAIVAEAMPSGEFARRWRCIDVVIDAGATVAREETTAGFMVDHGQVLFAGLGPLGAFRAGESLDGLGDLLFWGAGAAALAREVGAPKLDGGSYGWMNRALDEIRAQATVVQDRIAAAKLEVRSDYRPHCNRERLNAQVRGGESRFGQLVLDGARVAGGDNRWGDGIFEVSRLFDAAGRVVRVRVELGTEERQVTWRRVVVPQLEALVSRRVLDDAEPVRFSERFAPQDNRDSGWVFSSGTERGRMTAKTFAVVPMRTVLTLFPALEATLVAPVGARFRLDGDRYVEDPADD